jgi:phosphatidylglycerophosphatase A
MSPAPGLSPSPPPRAAATAPPRGSADAEFRLRNPAGLIASGFGLGLIPIAPGTCASLAALACAWPIRARWGAAGLGAATVLVFAGGCWAAGRAAKAMRARDPGAVVIDEVAAQWLALLAAPFSPLGSISAFLLFRIFDIWKPWPVSWADRRVKGGLGIMLDDLLAAAYACLLLKAASAIGGPLRVLA